MTNFVTECGEGGNEHIENSHQKYSGQNEVVDSFDIARSFLVIVRGVNFVTKHDQRESDCYLEVKIWHS